MAYLNASTSISIASLWPEGVAIGTATLYSLCVKRVFATNTVGGLQVRALSFVGLLSTLYLIYLGLYPSYFSIGALLVVPAALIFVICLFQPQFATRWRYLRAYLRISVGLSLLVALLELIWLLRRRQKG